MLQHYHFIPPITLLQEKAVEFLVILQKLKEFWSLLETGVEIVGAIQAVIILAKKDLTGILKICQRDMIINTLIPI